MRVQTASPLLSASLAADAPPHPSDQPVVVTRKLGRTYGDVIAAAAIDLTVAPGEILALIGPNGAGKSTVMKMLTTLLSPTDGEAWVAGHDIRREPSQVRRRIGYVPQLPSADTELTGYENMLLSARLYLIPRRERADRIAELLSMMELADVQDRPVATYSGGMARRLEIAQSTLHRPAVLFLDEPTVGLDPGGRLAVWAHVRRVRQHASTAVIFSTHYMDEAEEVADRIALINRGHLVGVGTAEQLKNRHHAPSLDALFTTLAGRSANSGDRNGCV